MQAAVPIALVSASVFVCLVVTVLIARNLAMPGAKPLLAAVVAELWWLLTYAGQMMVGSRSLTVALSRLEWLGVVVIPVAWAVFVVEYTGRGEYLARRHVAVLSVVPAVTLVGVLVSYDGVIRQPVQLATYDGMNVVSGSPGPLYLVFSVYTWLLITGSAILLIEFIVDRQPLYRNRAVALLGAGVVPVVASITDTMSLAGPESFQLTPMSFALSSGLAALAIVEFDMFRQAPVPTHLATETAIAATDDPTFVLDRGGTVVDCNPAALALAGSDRKTVLGASSDDVTGLSDVNGGTAPSTVSIESDDGTAYYDVQTTPIDSDGEHKFGTVVTLRDVTNRRERKERLDALNNVLRATIQEEVTAVGVAADGESPVRRDALDERLPAALAVSDRAGDLASMLDEEAESPADIVPIIHEEVDAAREWRPEVSFVLDASLGEWAYCNGLFEPVFRVSLRHAAERSLRSEAEPVVGISVLAGPESVTVSVSDVGPPLRDHGRAVLCAGAEPRPANGDDMNRWLVNWGVEQAGGTVRVGTDGDHTSLELTFPRTDGE